MCGKGNSNVICKKNGLLCKVPNKSPEENKKRRFLQSSRCWNKKHLGPFFYNITAQAVVGQIELHATLLSWCYYTLKIRSIDLFYLDQIRHIQHFIQVVLYINNIIVVIFFNPLVLQTYNLAIQIAWQSMLPEMDF